MYLYYYEDDERPEQPARRRGVDLRPTLRAAAWWTLGCAVLAALIVGSDVAGVQIPQMYLDLTAGE